MRNRFKYLSSIFALAGLLISACNSGSDTPTSTSGNGSVAVQMTDATTDLFSSANVYVKAVHVKPRGRAAVTIATDVGLIDVLELQGTVREIAAASVTVGEYDYVQIDFDEARSYVVLKATGTAVPCAMASETVQVSGGFTVQASRRTTVTLDFRADESYSQLGDGTFLMAAVIVQIGVQVG